MPFPGSLDEEAIEVFHVQDVSDRKPCQVGENRLFLSYRLSKGIMIVVCNRMLIILYKYIYIYIYVFDLLVFP